MGGGGRLESALSRQPQEAHSFDNLAQAPSPLNLYATLSVSKNSLVPTVASLLPTICQSQLLWTPGITWSPQRSCSIIVASAAGE